MVMSTAMVGDEGEPNVISRLGAKIQASTVTAQECSIVGQLGKLRAGCIPALQAGCRGTLWVRRRLPACPTFHRGVPEQFLQ